MISYKNLLRKKFTKRSVQAVKLKKIIGCGTNTKPNNVRGSYFSPEKYYAEQRSGRMLRQAKR
jgi:hypothetical protein